MAKQFATTTDKLCASCDKSISSWDITKDGKTIEIPKKLVKERYCSWCFKKSKHFVTQKNYIKRNVYQCQSCAKSTVKCRKCKEGLRKFLDNSK